MAPAQLYAAVGVDYFGTAMMRTLLPQAALGMGWSATGVGSIESLYGLGQILGACVFGRLSDLQGRRRVLRLSCAGAALGYAIFASSFFGPASLLISRVPVGLSKQTLTVSRAIISDTSDGAARSKAMSRLTAVMGVGYSLGPIVGGFLADAFSPSLPAWLATVTFLGLIWACGTLPETSRGLKAERPPAPPWRLSPRLLRLLLALSLAEAALTAWTSTVLPPLARERLGGGFLTLGSFSSLLALVVTLNNATLLPWLCSHASDRTLVAAGHAAFAAAAALLWLEASAAALLLAVLPLSLGIGSMRSMPAALISRYAPPESQGEVMGLLDVCGSVCRMAAPLAAGLFIDTVGLAAAPSLLVCLCLGAWVLLPS